MIAFLWICIDGCEKRGFTDGHGSMVNPASESWSFILALLPARFRRSRALHQLAPQSDQRALTRRELGRPPRPSSLHFLGTNSLSFSVALSKLHGTYGTDVT